jgi:hypothetical protein
LIEKQARIIDEPVPAGQGNIIWWAVRVEPGKTLDPYSWSAGTVLDDAGALFLGIGPRGGWWRDTRDR